MDLTRTGRFFDLQDAERRREHLELLFLNAHAERIARRKDGAHRPTGTRSARPDQS